MKGLFLKYATMLVLLAGLVASCGESLEDTYSDYTGDGPEQYLTKIYDLQGTPRWMSVALSWKLKLDPGRTAILVTWTDDEKTDSVMIDRNSTSYTVEGLKNYEYELGVYAIEQTENGEIIKRSLGDPVYIRPFTYASDELILFGRVVRKQFNVADQQLFVTFEEWTDNLISFKIGYYEKNNPTEQFWEATPEDRVGNYPNGQPWALIGEDVDFGRSIKVYRVGKIAVVGDTELEMEPIDLYFELPSFESDFAVEVRNKLDLFGEIRKADIAEVEVLDIDYDQVSLTDILHFPKLKELHLGRNRILAPGTESVYRSVLTEQVISEAALRVAKERGVGIYHYGNHYFDIVPDFFEGKNLTAEVPMLTFLDPGSWSISVTPRDLMEYDSGLENLLKDDAAYWLPQSSASVREHVIEIDFGKEESIAGFKITQANIATAIQCPEQVKIERQLSTGQWGALTFQENTTLGRGKGETTVVYLDKNKTSQRCSKIRLRVSDLFFQKGYDSSWNYIDFYNTALGSFMVIKGE